MTKKKEAKRGRGRPPKKRIFTAAELRKQADDCRKKSQAHRLEIETLDVAEFCVEVMNITGKHRFTRKEMDEMRQKVDFIYQKYLQEKWEAEAKAMDPYREALRAIELSSSDLPHVKTMTKKEWNEQHGLRFDGSKKRGPAPKPKKTVWDLSPGEKGMSEGPSDPIDFKSVEEEIEVRVMEDAIRQKKEDARFPKGKRVSHGSDMNRQHQPRQKFWI